MTLGTENRPLISLSMPFDTVKLRSPAISEAAAERIEQFSVRRTADDLANGIRLYEFTTGQLLGSWDARIGFRVLREEFIAGSGQRPTKVPCKPFLIVECSLAKALFGQNIFGGPADFGSAVSQLIALLERYFGVALPAVAVWIVRRIDWAESFAMPYSAIQEYFRHIQSVEFPRRRAHKYGDQGLYFPGSTTTVKLYHKGPEFAKHDSPRLKRALRSANAERVLIPRDKRSLFQADPSRQIRALQRLANTRLRAEVEIHADKLDFDFGHAPCVDEVTSEYAIQVYEIEMRKLIRESEQRQCVVRTALAVGDRLRSVFGKTHGNRLHGFWSQMATSGEAECKKTYPTSTFYRYRKQLQDVGVSWLNTDVQLCTVRNGLPADFAPIRSDPRLCTRPARARWRVDQLKPISLSAHH